MQSDKRIWNPELDNTINIFLRQRDIGDIFFQVQKCSFILKIFEAYSLSSSSLIILVCKVDQKPINMKPVKQHITKMPGPEKKPYQLYRSQKAHRKRQPYILPKGHTPSAHLAWSNTCETTLLCESAASPRMIFRVTPYLVCSPLLPST